MVSCAMIDGFVGQHQNITMVAGNSITILPNSTISFGSDYLAKIDPEIPSNCASTPESNSAPHTNLNAQDFKISSLLPYSFWPVN